MNTPAHLIFGAALFARPDAWKINVAAIIGAFLPDFSLYFMVFWNRFINQIPFEIIFRDLYYSDFWQTIFAIDNSFFVWGLALACALALRSPVGLAFTGSGLLHIALDFPLHHDDGRAHFWPLSDWIFESPVSYWDPSAYGGIVSIIELAACAILLFVLWRRFSGMFARALVMLTAAAQILPALMFGLMFAD